MAKFLGRACTRPVSKPPVTSVFSPILPHLPALPPPLPDFPTKGPPPVTIDPSLVALQPPKSWAPRQNYCSAHFGTLARPVNHLTMFVQQPFALQSSFVIVANLVVSPHKRGHVDLN